VLEPVSASVPEARRFVMDRLTGIPGDAVDVARLLVSELVTNAVLHARTELTLTLDRTGTVVRVQVEDGNPRLPVLRTHGSDASTGRGLGVIDKMATSWGTHSIEGGKVVWFEIQTEVEDTAASTVSEQPEELATLPESTAEIRVPRPSELRFDYGVNENLVAFRWVGLPIAAVDRTAEHYDSVLREFRMVLEREPATRAAVPGHLLSLMDELTEIGPLIAVIEQDLERGRRSGVDYVDVELQLPREIGPIALRLDNLLDEADAYCAAGRELLTLEPSVEVVSIRKWLIGELIRQAEGHPPVTWHDSPWSGSS
jgi:Histidine kinase-like ATPase domain